MAKKKETFVFDKLDTPVVKQNVEIIQNIQQSNNNVLVVGGSTKITFDCTNDLVDMMKDYGYWEGLSQKEIIIESLLEFFENKDIKVRPEKVKNRKKVGRKPKVANINPYYQQGQ
jgi:putative NADH-flavin reductase